MLGYNAYRNGILEQQARQNRTQDLQNQLLQEEINSTRAERARLDAQGKASARLAQQFLTSWNASLGNLNQHYNQATESLSRSWDLIDDASGRLSGIDDVVADIESSLADYRQAYTPLRDEAIADARQGIQDRRTLTGNIMDLSRADYEGAAGMAKADIAGEMESGRRATEREMASLGISPNSRGYGDTMRRNRVSEAVSKVLAGNLARIGEKNRVAGISIAGMNAINPSVSAGIASNISQGEGNLQNMRTGAVATGINAATSIANAGQGLTNAATNIAGSYGQNVTTPIGEMYAGTLGSALSLSPGSAPTNAPAASQQSGINTTGSTLSTATGNRTTMPVSNAVPQTSIYK